MEVRNSLPLLAFLLALGLAPLIYAQQIGPSPGSGGGSGITALTGDVTATGPGSAAATVEAIKSVAVGTPTGTGNVVFSASPTFTGTISAANENLSGSLGLTSTTGTPPTNGFYLPVANVLGFSVNSLKGLEIDGAASIVNAIDVIPSAAGNALQITATGSDSNVTLQLSGKGTGGAAIKGTSTGDSAVAGYVGELASVSTGSGLAMTSTHPVGIIGLQLTPGTWDVVGDVQVYPAASTTVVLAGALVSTTSNIITGANNCPFFNVTLISFINPVNGYSDCVTPPTRIALSATTTVWLDGVVWFGTSTLTAGGTIRATRMR